VKILFTSILLILAFQASFRQDGSKSILIETIQQGNPEIFGAAVSNLTDEIEKKPHAFIYAVIHPNQNSLSQAWTAEGFLKGAVKFTGIDTNNFLILRGVAQETFSIEFWQVSDKTNISQIRSNWNFALPKNAKPFIVYDWSFDSTNSFLGYEKIFSDFLMANSKAIGQIRIFAKTIKEFQEEKAKLISELSNISVKQLRFIWNKYDYSAGAGEWKIIPKT
jgi:hypothetical protein